MQNLVSSGLKYQLNVGLFRLQNRITEAHYLVGDNQPGIFLDPDFK